ncbi:MAG: hypothetical protein LBU88_09480 [Treponema sp.]|jgi:hypothetical protein|nr:hypothetical protein [Treponema sp.]
MNKYSLVSILLIAVIVFCACNSTPKPQEEVFEPSLKSPSIILGEIEVQFNRPFPLIGIVKRAVNVLYYPTEDAVCLQWRMDMVTYHQFWSPEGRELFVSALLQYKEDFEERNFGSNNRRSKRKYGTTSGYIYWQTFSIAVLANTANKVELGYYFVNRQPYFIANQREADYIDPLSRESNRTHPEMPIYFTRAQADSLAEFFDPIFLSEAVSNSSAIIRDTEIGIDEY